jgi:predicted DsbA family dithiol-disulfide isomerase
MRRPQWNPNTVPVHLATIYAKEKGLDDQFHHVAAQAFWETGVNLGDLAILKGIAEKVGLDWSELSHRLESEKHREAVYNAHEEAKALGVGGTPTYKIGGELKFGNLSVDDLEEMIRQASA